MMPRLGNQKTLIELRKLFFLESVRQDLKPFAAARFDQRRNQQEIHQPIRLFPANQSMQRDSIGTGAK